MRSTTAPLFCFDVKTIYRPDAPRIRNARRPHWPKCGCDGHFWHAVGRPPAALTSAAKPMRWTDATHNGRWGRDPAKNGSV